ncbi:MULTISPECIES: UDP-N-acetylglucosamine 1-carboxyvinyltransferase [unclassified Nitratiruptor]|uniref:UDP-N-acetylglucosamine 1-carboxyvinyltransferase n=1 Tax=unclassified Nitratiruptor TaxID=2624044 RepID=UPI001915539F|nr:MULTISPECIES: UDP-N-acetylglucosamine 1-carboxyvinyltransferase [unclassified Nitratiruptor]BCD60328.1 UDP-N-acetylglucosamine 1-carboxyvinyltransferase [Nitratiruptor sp. YY08-10]BCD64183.1 UDP-N-acetylglucosamine 1-carboxyvinyltransferase [Nitratiruptor sp. YY08-14]
MDFLRIEGGKTLKGSVPISGAKNAALPLIASTILSKQSVQIDNLPDVQDIKTLLRLLQNLGASYQYEDGLATIDASKLTSTVATYDIVRTMRASILVLGPILAKYGRCEVSLPGGCAIGQRPIDLHLQALEQMGAKITIKAGYVIAEAPRGLQGSTIIFDKITVTGTENIVMAAALAKGKTTIINAAKEPEVVQLCEVLKDAGVEIDGIGSDELVIHGTNRESLEMKSIHVIPDRIEAGTYLCAGAMTNSTLSINNVIPHHLDSVLVKLRQMGFPLDIEDTTITIHPASKIEPVEIITSEYPGFPTDMQAQFMALALLANGASIIEERLFENRFMHVSELKRFGANIQLKGNIATVIGPTELWGADVMATDLRASSALVLAGLAAKGTTNVHRIYHLDRGYEKLEEKLNALGASVQRLSE